MKAKRDYLPKEKLEKYLNVNLSSSLSFLVSRGMTEDEFTNELTDKFTSVSFRSTSGIENRELFNQDIWSLFETNPVLIAWFTIVTGIWRVISDFSLIDNTPNAVFKLPLGILCRGTLTQRKISVVASRLVSGRVRAQVGTLRCVLGQDILLLQCLSPPRCINRYRRIYCWG